MKMVQSPPCKIARISSLHNPLQIITGDMKPESVSGPPLNTEELGIAVLLFSGLHFRITWGGCKPPMPRIHLRPVASDLGAGGYLVLSGA